VSAYLNEVRQEAGSIDILFNLMGPQPGEFSHGRPTLDVPLEHFLLPLTTVVKSQFITGRAAARHMVAQGSGVILFLTAIPSRGLANVTAIGSAFGAIESLARCLAVDLGPSGVRVVCIRAGGMPDTRTIQQSVDTVARQQAIPREQVLARFEQATLLKRLTTANDTARLAAFLASDHARTITGAIVNASAGHIMD
jgi:3-oxoacyl-[acyl-carrier protein] reductase